MNLQNNVSVYENAIHKYTFINAIFLFQTHLVFNECSYIGALNS